MPALPPFPPTARPIPEEARATRAPAKHIPQITPTLLYQDVIGLKKLLPEADFVDASHLLQDMRMVKSEEEIEILRGAGRIARKVVDAMIESARPGVPEAAVYAEMIRTHIANGGEPNIFNLFTPGPVEHPKNKLWPLLLGSGQRSAPTL